MHGVIEAKTHMHTPNFATATKSHHSDHQSPADQYCRLGYGSLVVSILDEARIHYPSRPNEIQGVIEAKTHMHTPPYPNIPPFRSPEPSRPLLSPLMWFTGRIYPRWGPHTLSKPTERDTRSDRSQNTHAYATLPQYPTIPITRAQQTITVAVDVVHWSYLS